MRVIVLKIKLRASWVHSLKEKRMIVKSIISKLKNKFNISVCEVDEQDIYQSIVIGVSSIAGGSGQADSIIQNILDFIDLNTDAEIIDIEENIEVY